MLNSAHIGLEQKTTALVCSALARRPLDRDVGVFRRIDYLPVARNFRWFSVHLAPLFASTFFVSGPFFSDSIAARLRALYPEQD
jgi:hypothetical protein